MPTAAKKPGGAAVPFWQRLTPTQRALVIAALLAAVTLPRLDKVVEPFAKGFALSSRIVEGEDELKRLDAQHASLSAQMAQLQTIEGLKLEIREATGQVAPGEYPLRVIVPPASSQRPAARPVPFMRAHGLDIDSIALAIRDCIAGATEVFLKWAGIGRAKDAPAG